MEQPIDLYICDDMEDKDLQQAYIITSRLKRNKNSIWRHDGKRYNISYDADYIDKVLNERKIASRKKSNILYTAKHPKPAPKNLLNPKQIGEKYQAENPDKINIYQDFVKRTYKKKPK
jgi:hypothetical protein